MALFILPRLCSGKFFSTLLMLHSVESQFVCTWNLHCAYLLRNANELLGKSCVIKFYSSGRIVEFGKRNEMPFDFMGTFNKIDLGDVLHFNFIPSHPIWSNDIFYAKKCLIDSALLRKVKKGEKNTKFNYFSSSIWWSATHSLMHIFAFPYIFLFNYCLMWVSSIYSCTSNYFLLSLTRAHKTQFYKEVNANEICGRCDVR